MKYKKSLFFICLLICLFSIASVVASDVNETAVASEDQNDEIISIDDNIEEVSATDGSELSTSIGTYKDLSDEIKSKNDGETLILQKDYQYNLTNDVNDLKISKAIIIDGNGHYVDGNNAASLFSVWGNNVILKNITFKNAKSNYAALTWNGINGSLVNCTFENNLPGSSYSVVSWASNADNGKISNTKFINTTDSTFISFAGNLGAIIDSQFENSSKTAILYYGNNFTIKNCSFDDINGTLISIYGNNGKISSLSLEKNVADAIMVSGSNITITDSQFMNNIAQFINVYRGQNLTISNSIFKNNKNPIHITEFTLIKNCTFENHTGYSVFSGYIPNIQIVNNIFKNNNVTNVVRFNGDNIFLKNNTFSNNVAGDDGILFLSGNNHKILDNHFLNNVNENRAGAVYIKGNNNSFSNCEFLNCSAKSDGGAIYISGNNESFVDCKFINCSGRYGGAIYVLGNNLTIFNCNFMNNSATSDGGSIEGRDNDNVTIENCNFINGYSKNNHAFISMSKKNILISKCNFINGSSSSGALAISGSLRFGGDNLKVIDCNFTNCSSKIGAGSINAVSNLIVINCNFVNSSTKNYGGGAINAMDNLTVYNCMFINCSSGEHGGAILAEDNCTLDNCYFNNCSSISNGGSIYYDDRGNNLAILNSIFNNTGDIGLRNCKNILINNSKFSNNVDEEYLIWISYVNNVTISNSNLSTNNKAIYTTYTENVTIENNKIHVNGDVENGIQVSGGTSVIKNNIIEVNSSNNDITGISVGYNAECEIIGNEITSSGTSAISVSNSNVTVKNNALTANGKEGDEAIINQGGTVETEGNTKVYLNPNLQVIADSKFDENNLNMVIEIDAIINETATENVTVTISKSNGEIVKRENVTIINGKANFILSNLADGEYNYTVDYSGDYNFKSASVNGTITVKDPRTVPNLDILADTVLDTNELVMVVYINTTTDATGKVTVKFYDNEDNLLVSEDVDIVDGKVVFIEPYLADGDYKFTVEYAENVNFKATTVNGTVSVKDQRNATVLNVDAKVSFDMNNLVNIVTITTSANINGNITVTLYLDDGTVEYAENITMTRGKATFIESFLSAGKYSYKVEFFGDLSSKQNYTTGNITINKHTTTITPQRANVDYGFTYKVLVKIDGKVVGAGKEIVLKIAGKTLKAKTDKNGYAKFSLAVKPKKYAATLYMNNVNDEFKGTKKVSVTVKNVIKAKNLKVKKSAKKLKIKVTLKTSAKKPIKGKKITLKIKGKKIKATTNKKGVATFKVKKSILKKLKAGKKYKYQVIYGKDKVKKTLKVKK